MKNNSEEWNSGECRVVESVEELTVEEWSVEEWSVEEWSVKEWRVYMSGECRGVMECRGVVEGVE